MSEKVKITIDLTLEEYRQLEDFALQRGYESLTDYVHALIESDAEVHDQAYFWTEEWQAGEHEADEDIAAGRVKTFDTMDELIADLMDDE
jgi:hypothetical protein